MNKLLNYSKKIFEKYKKNKVAKNAGWIIGGKIAQMVISFFVGVLTTRFLGPSNYGLINYGSTYINFLMPLCTLGFNSILVKEIITHPKREGTVLGTAIFFRLVSSTVAMGIVNLIVAFVDAAEPLTRLVVFLSSFSVVFNAFEMISYWFQSRLESKVSTIASLIAFVVFSLYRIILIVTGKGVEYFAFASSVDHIVVALVLYIAFRRSSDQKLSIDFNLGKNMLSRSYHFILPSIMVSVYGQTDKIMLKHMISSSEIGYYSIAQSLCNIWCFVLYAVIDSMFPTIFQANKDNNEGEFNRLNKILYAIIFYVSIFVSFCICLLAPIIIKVLYGEAFMPAVAPLRIVTWYTAFSYLGVAREAWIISRDRQKYLKYVYISAALLNVLLNLLLIPHLGASGAALASLTAQVLTALVVPLFISGLRENTFLMFEAIMLKGLKRVE